MVAIVVILAAVISIFAFGFAENFSEPAPTVGDTTGEFVPGADEQIVRISHIAGDSVPVEEIEIIVRASGPGDDLPLEARLVNLPSDGYQTSIDSNDIQGDNFIDDSRGLFGTDPDQIIIAEDSNTWSAGRTIEFGINVGGGGDIGADFRDPPDLKNDDGEADTLEVVIVHTPSNSILSEHTFTP
jgi:FlaG/FlaF family flagellin (archaellin)